VDLFRCIEAVTKEGNITHKKTETPYEIVSLSGKWEEERSLFELAVKRGVILLFVSSKKQSTWLEKMLSAYRVVEHIDSSEYISLEVLRFLLRKKEWSRKESVLLLRLMKWLARTETGRIDEIKWYGDEVRYKEVLRART
jgi:hypothetical protein